MNDLRLELKVCEGCGALWVRPTRAPGVYCGGCTRKLSEFPDALGRRTAHPRTGQFRGAETENGHRFQVIAGGAR
jgi:hypothetical protein